MRKNIYEIMHSANISLKTEYERLYSLLHRNDLYVGESFTSIHQLSEHSCKYFDLAFTNRAISLKEIEKAFGYTFTQSPRNITIEYIVSYCELSVNLCYQLEKIYNDEEIGKEYLGVVKRNVNACMDELGYVQAEHKGVYIFTEKKPEAIAVAEIVDNTLSYKVLEYNHYRLKGNLDEKLGILKLMADDIEPFRNVLNGINKSFADTLFQMLQKFVRHNNNDNTYIRNLSDEEIENCYDDIYQMWLLAKLELDNVERKRRATEIIRKINA